MSSTYSTLLIKDLYDQLKPVQKEMFELALNNKKSRKYIIHCSRRLGKTHLLCVLASVIAFSKPNAQIRYASVTQKAVRNMVKPIFQKIFTRYKKHLRPRWNTLEGAYIFSNGSMIHVAGVNNGHSDDLRGTDADLAIVDEAAFVDQLEYLVESVLMPQLINTGGSLLMASSSPLSPSHEFAQYILDAKQSGHYSSFDIYKAGYDKEIVEEFKKEAGGENSTAWRREYLNELIVDTSLAIIPEFQSSSWKHNNIQPKHYDVLHKYVSMDLGVRDLNVTLFGYYDFERAKLVIEAEHVINGPEMTTQLLHKELSEIELKLWNGKEPHKRIADNNNPLLLLDLGSIHNMFFHSTSKDTLHAMVNNLRIWFKNNRIEISDQCTTLIDSLKYGVWNSSRTEFDRSRSLGHYDAVAALMYLVRNVDEVSNPIPFVLGHNQVDFSENERFENFKKLGGLRG